MCGIIGFAGKTEAVPILLDGLERLEYRGYDSAGVAVVSADGRLQVKKSKGRLSVLRELLDSQNPLSGNIGIGHTKWATHGEPNDTNAHPHVGQEGKIAVVHNGIIENYPPLPDHIPALLHPKTDTARTDHIPLAALPVPLLYKLFQSLSD